jgi:type IV secretion system protein VirB11
MFLNAVATASGVDFGPGQPLLSAELPDRLGRLQGFLPPVSTRPLLVLRKPAPEVLALADLEQTGFVPAGVARSLRRALVEHQTILVIGGTGTGKTTFLNSLLAELAALCPEERIAVLEDTPELACSSPDRISLRTGSGLDLYGLLGAVLRASPHRIVVGEVRDRSALAMLDAWNTGHSGGLATLHANNCQDALLRLGTLVQRANVPPQNELIAATVGLVVRLAGTASRTRRVVELARLTGYDPAARRFVLETLYDERNPDETRLRLVSTASPFRPGSGTSSTTRPPPGARPTDACIGSARRGRSRSTCPTTRARHRRSRRSSSPRRSPPPSRWMGWTSRRRWRPPAPRPSAPPRSPRRCPSARRCTRRCCEIGLLV